MRTARVFSYPPPRRPSRLRSAFPCTAYFHGKAPSEREPPSSPHPRLSAKGARGSLRRSPIPMSTLSSPAGRRVNTPRQVLFASLIGTTIEFFDFYIYATAAVLVFPRLFFPATDPASSTLASLATFGI